MMLESLEHDRVDQVFDRRFETDRQRIAPDEGFRVDRFPFCDQHPEMSVRVLVQFGEGDGARLEREIVGDALLVSAVHAEMSLYAIPASSALWKSTRGMTERKTLMQNRRTAGRRGEALRQD